MTCKNHIYKRCDFNVLLSVDPTPPVCTPPQDISRTIPLGSGTTSITWTEPRATDNCGQVTLQSRTHEPGDQFGRGTTSVTYVFVDGSQNAVTCGFSITIIEGKFSSKMLQKICYKYQHLYYICNRHEVCLSISTNTPSIC